MTRPTSTFHDPQGRAGRLGLASGLGSGLASGLASGLVLALVLAVSACGGGGGGADAPASNGSSTTLKALGLPAAVEQALASSSGDAGASTQAELNSAAQTLLNAQRSGYGVLKAALFGLNAADGSANASSLTALNWDPSHDSSSFTVLDRVGSQPILTSNWSYKAGSAGSAVATLAVAGVHAATEGRYAAFGGNALGVPGNAAMDQFMRNTVAWLTRGRSVSAAAGTPAGPLKIVTAHLPGSETYWFPHEAKVRSWFAASYPGVSINGVATSQAAAQADNLCDGAAKLAACLLPGADLLVIGRELGPLATAADGAAIAQVVKDAQTRGVAVLYLHHYRDSNELSAALLDYFGLAAQVNNNYWDEYGLKDWSPASSLPAMPGGLDAIQDLLNRLDHVGFTSTWSGCSSGSAGRVSCAGDATYVAQFDQPANTIRNALRSLDASSTAIFSRPGYLLEKLLVLLGDRYRQAVSYPLSKTTSGGLAWYRAYFSDMAAYLHRPSTAVAKNLGNFADPIPADTPALNGRSVSVAVPAAGTRDHMTGLYVMPGRRITLTRTDTEAGSSAVVVRYGINMLRDSTWVFDEPAGLDRPTRLASPRPALAPGQSVSLVSPYGGPLFLFVDAPTAAAGAGQPATTPPSSITVQVDGVTTHPVLRDATDAAQVATFKAELASTPTRWVGMTSDTLVLHSTLAHFKQSLAAHGGDVAKLAARTWTYTIQDTYELAGFNASSGRLALAPEVLAVCRARGWDCTGPQHRRDTVQHVISDVHATCGAGCSGNPYDQDWAFEPLGWGETHEIGHNLQRTRLNVYGGQSGEVSNNVFPMHKRMRYNASAEGQMNPLIDRAGTAKAIFTTLQTAQASADPTTTAYNAIWADPAYAANNSARVLFYRQLVEFARHYNAATLGDGWPLITLLYLHDRNLEAAGKTPWTPTLATSLGLGTYAAYPSSMTGNDFLLITTSSLIGRDMRGVFDLWGVTYSGAAAAQVAAYSLPAAEKVMFPMAQVSQATGNVGAPVGLGPAATYPVGY
ncbi:MAG: hypothetical protein RIQ60_1900 [Pseudomonadota bacterium]|jgi:hypothetical protein